MSSFSNRQVESFKNVTICSGEIELSCSDVADYLARKGIKVINVLYFYGFYFLGK